MFETRGNIIIFGTITHAFSARRLKYAISATGVIVMLLAIIAQVVGQQSAPTPSSAEFVSKDGLAVERLIELGSGRRNDLLAARQRLAIAEGRLVQAGLRPNPTLESEYGSPRFLGGEAEQDISIGLSQTFELGGKRSRRIAVAELELNQTRAEVLALERRLSVEVRTAYAEALAAARQLDVLERLIAADEEVVRAVEARLKEGDVAPLDVNLTKVEADRLRIQAIQAKKEIEIQLLQIRTLIGADITESLRIAPQPERPPRLDLGLNELTEIALKERADLQAAKIGERLGGARVDLARANAVPNIAGKIRYSRNKQIIDFPPVLRVAPFPQTDSSLTFGVAVDLPFFNRNQGEIAAATGEKVQAVRQQEFLEATVKRDVAIALLKYRAAAEALVVYSTQILPRAEANLQSVRSAYGLGEFSIFEVVAEQRRLTENFTGYNQTLRDYYTALAELEAAIGVTIPPTGFSSLRDSVLPDRDLVPTQIDREKFLQSIRTVGLPKKSVFSNAETKKEKKEE